VFRPDLDPQNPPTPEFISQRFAEQELEADVAWQAVPFLNHLPADAVVWHQLRHPLKILCCWASHNILSGTNYNGELIRRALPECNIGTELERAIKYILGWNRMVSESGKAVRVFKIEEANAAFWAELMAMEVGLVQQAMGGIALDMGKCIDPHANLTWADVRVLPGGQELANLAAMQGY
jgi:hypothetical protein